MGGPGSGRRPQPTALKILRGNPGRRPLNAHEPRLRPRLPRPPRDLSDAERREWYRLGRRLRAAGLMTELDGVALEALVKAYARWREASQRIAEDGLLVPGRGGVPTAHPLLAVEREMARQVTRLLVEFGMSPSSRSKVKAEVSAEAGGGLEAFLR